MFLDARELDKGAVVKADLCIIGAGAAGITIARQFVGKAVSVCVLESGGLELDSDTQSLYAGEAVQERVSADHAVKKQKMHGYLSASRLRYFGGTTNHWSGMCRPLDELDFERRDWVPHSGWPINREQLWPYYESACEVVEISSFDRVNEEVSSRLYKFGDGKRVVNKIFHFSPPTRFGARYKEELSAAENVRVYNYANALAFNEDRVNPEIRHLDAGCLTGNRFTVEARIYVLATGGIENARMLLNSQNARESGVGNEHDLVGRFFMEHIENDIGGMSVNAPGSVLSYYGKRRFQPELGHAVFPVLFFGEDIQREKKLLGCSVRVEPWASPENKPAFLTLSDFDKHVVLQTRAFEGARLNEQAPVYARLSVAAEQAPNPDSRVMLDADQDEFGQRRSKLNWRLSSTEFDSIVACFDVLGMELGRHGQGRVNYKFDAFAAESIGYGWHHMGTTRMSNNPGSGVVDENCRVHSVENLYVAGSSVFPTCGCVNPTLTIVALALRLAAHVKKELQV